ncbi:MAG: hypothetical protein ACE5OZ_18770 [Candidatus Heimdallarchaeota archaeon]
MALIDDTVLTLAVASFGGLAGLYGALQSYLNNRKTRQLTLEMLMTKLDLDFQYEIIESDAKKVLHGTITLKNLGNTNLRVPEFSFEGKDRSEEFSKAFDGEDFAAANNFEIKQFIGVSNSHLVKFGRSARSFFISHEDKIYGQRKGETRVRSLDFRENIARYISRKTEALREAMASSDESKSFGDLFFKEALSKEIRGMELFPGAEKTQEFMFEYSGNGVLYLNAETTALRMLQSSVDAFEELKTLGAELLHTEAMTTEQENRFQSLAKASLMPESKELEKQKETFLIYLK